MRDGNAAHHRRLGGDHAIERIFDDQGLSRLGFERGGSTKEYRRIGLADEVVGRRTDDVEALGEAELLHHGSDNRWCRARRQSDPNSGAGTKVECRGNTWHQLCIVVDRSDNSADHFLHKSRLVYPVQLRRCDEEADRLVDSETHRQTVPEEWPDVCTEFVETLRLNPVSYTHLTLP